MRKILRAELANILSQNVCEVVFVRRRPERAPGRSLTRRMITTNSINLLTSENGIRSLNFRLPKGPKQINEQIHNIVVAWDIIMQDYRNISMDDCYLVQTIPDDDNFWKFYNEILYPMSKEQKLQFMDGL